MKKIISIFFILSLFTVILKAEIKHHIKISAITDKVLIKKNETFKIKVDFNIDKHYHSYPSKEQIGPEGI